MPQIDTMPAYMGSEAVADTAAMGLPVCAYDTLFSPQAAATPTLRRSLFTHHELPVRSHREKSIQHQGTPGWYLAVVVLSVFLVCNYIRRKQINMIDLLQSAIDHRALDRLLRDANLTHPSSLAPIALIMLIPLSLVGHYSFMPHSSIMLTDMLHYALLLVGCYVLYFIRNSTIRLLGNAFGNSESVNVYLSSNYIYHLLYAVVGAAMSFFVCYTGNMGDTFLYILLGLIGLLASVRFLRGMQIILTLSKTSKFYLFYYLCTFEIVPIVFIVKAASSY